uniref:Uncharacterized protein n=1 Tax=Rhizophora mucronata TaxID=61149 RepID=A0A2P2NCN1_RHIMU
MALNRGCECLRSNC